MLESMIPPFARQCGRRCHFHNRKLYSTLLRFQGLFSTEWGSHHQLTCLIWPSSANSAVPHPHFNYPVWSVDILKRNNVKILGRGPRTMLLAHGFGCDQNMWRHLVP